MRGDYRKKNISLGPYGASKCLIRTTNWIWRKFFSWTFRNELIHSTGNAAIIKLFRPRVPPWVGDLGGKSRDTWTVNLVPDGCRRRLKKFCWLADGEWNGRRLINVKNLWFSADGSTLNFGRVCASWPQLSCLFPSGNWCRNFPFFGGNSSYRSI